MSLIPESNFHMKDEVRRPYNSFSSAFVPFNSRARSIGSKCSADEMPSVLERNINNNFII